MRYLSGGLDVQVGVGVPFRSIDVLRDEYRVVDTDFARDRGAEVTNKDQVTIGNLYRHAEGIAVRSPDL